MPLPRLLLITNPRHDSAAEDRFLAHYLAEFFDVETVAPREAPDALETAERCLIRNAWPADACVDAFKEIERLIKERNILAYNPLHRRGYLEDKTYLLKLFQEGFPVIPSVDRLDDLDKLGAPERYVLKPLDGCSSRGVRIVPKQNLGPLTGHILQPFMDFAEEISFYFIDDQFTYALVSAGPGRRWNLVEYQPTKDELAWAQKFVEWNELPYGLQRIDGMRLHDGTLLLVEIEDQMPLLSLDALPTVSAARVCSRLAESLCLNLLPNKPFST